MSPVSGRICFNGICFDELQPRFSCMKPAHLRRHISTKHPSHVEPPEFFKREPFLRIVSTTSAKALEASHAVSLLVDKATEPFTIAEDLLPLAAVVFADTMLDKNLLQNRYDGNRHC